MEIKKIWLNLFCTPLFYKINKLLWVVGSRGMGFMNSLDYITSGEKNLIKILEKYLPSRCVVFDVGANLGTYSVMVKQLIPNSLIYSFEPLTRTFEKLKKNIKSKDIKLFNSALSSDVPIEKIFFNNNEKGQIFSDELKDGDKKRFFLSEKIKTIKLDDFCKKEHVRYINLLKMDVEGWEYEVLVGAQNMIREKKIDFIQFEVGEENLMNKKTLYDFKELLNDYDFYRLLTKGLKRIHMSSAESQLYLFQNILAVRKDVKFDRRKWR